MQVVTTFGQIDSLDVNVLQSILWHQSIIKSRKQYIEQEYASGAVWL